MKSFNRSNRKFAVGALVVAIFNAAPIGSAMAQDGAERIHEFHTTVNEQRSNSEQNFGQAHSTNEQVKQSDDRSESFKRFQKRHRYGFLKPNGR